MVSACTDVKSAIVPELQGNLRPGTSPIGEVGADQDPVRLCIILNVVRVGFPISVAVMGILLTPIRGRVPEIDIVAKGLFLAASDIGDFPAKPIVLPVIIECHRIGYTHGKNEESSSVSPGATRTDDPVLY